jgi:hypothetical protein
MLEKRADSRRATPPRRKPRPAPPAPRAHGYNVSMHARLGMGLVLAVAIAGSPSMPGNDGGLAAAGRPAPQTAVAAPRTAVAAPRAAQSKDITIDHVTPRRDFVGPEPARFVWTPVEGADSYSIGVWNEVDVLMWRLNNIPQASVERPPQVHFEAGTYFWSIVALRNGEQIADSGLAAFVVKDEER